MENPGRGPRWPLWSMMALGLWMTSVPFSLSAGEPVLLAGILGGMVVFGLAFFALLHAPLRHLAYLNAFVGAAVLAARLLEAAPWPLWAGPALIALALAEMALTTPPLPDTPPGWFHNPSAWVQRAPMILLAALGALGARGGHWTLCASLLALLAAMTGDRRRWETAPWAAGLSAVLTGASVLLAAARLATEPAAGPLATTLAGLLLLTLASDELAATRLFLRHAPQLGQGSVSAFFRGGLLPVEPFMPRPDRHPSWAPPTPRRHSRKKRR